MTTSRRTILSILPWAPAAGAAAIKAAAWVRELRLPAGVFRITKPITIPPNTRVVGAPASGAKGQR